MTQPNPLKPFRPFHSMPLIAAGILAAALVPFTAQSQEVPTEMLSDGDFKAGLKKWTLELSGPAKGKASVVMEGPTKKEALQVEVLTKGEQSWQIQLHQGGLKIEKGRKYTLTYWVKADRPTTITVNCMQNHEPWEHHGAATEVEVTRKWKQETFKFVGPWDDTNARITFTNLATVPGQTYWFAMASLTAGPKPAPAKPKPQTSSASANRVVVWDGEKANSFGGWANPPTSSYSPKAGDAHSGTHALEFRFNDEKIWLGCGFHWFGWKTGKDVGTDVSRMTHLTFWIKAQGVTGDLDAQLLCNGEVLDTPEHHTAKVKVAKYCPKFRDGQWHEVVVPLADLTQPEGFDARIVSQLLLGFMPDGKANGSFLLDDIAFENREAN
jgi:hypothetical protein